MNLEEKLRQLEGFSKKSGRENRLQEQLESLQRKAAAPLPAQRVPHGIEEYVQGGSRNSAFGECFMAGQALPFGRPYGKMRIGDIAAGDLSPLELVLEGAALPASSRLLFLDIETTGSAGDAGVRAFLVGIGAIRESQFVVRQFFLRNEAEEKALLAATAEECEFCDGLVTFNGKTFDVPVLTARYDAFGLPSPFARLTHLDLLHPSRRLWKLRLESCHLAHLETHVLGIAREGDVPGAEIPDIYFDYLRTGDARGLQPVFFHNALDVISLAALTIEMARLIRAAQDAAQNNSWAADHPGLDLFSLSRMFQRAGANDLSLSICARAIQVGLPESVEPFALWQLALHHKRRGKFENAEQLWLELTQRQTPFAVESCRELAMHYEHRQRNAVKALEFTERAITLLSADVSPTDAARSRSIEHFTHRQTRLRKRLAIGPAAPQ